MKRFFALFFIASLLNAQVRAAGDAKGTGAPPRPTDGGDVAFKDNNGPTFQFTVQVVASCFPVNVRNVQNPLAPTSTVTMNLPLLTNVTNANGNASIQVSFPAALSTGQANVATLPATITGITGASAVNATIAGNTMMIEVPGVMSTTNNNQPFTLDPNNPVTFTQTVAAGYSDPNLPQNFVGFNGPLSSNVVSSLSSDGSELTLSVAFPGSVVPGAIGGLGYNSPRYGLCGSFYSPLMVFFTADKRPSLTAVSSFPLRPEGETFYWPEGSKDWAFLVYDGKGDGKIDTAEQLFGSLGYKNGFEALRRFDSNKDGKIDKHDQEFAHIKLWYDLNGNGKVDKGELKSLSSAHIDSISLEYKDDRITPIGERGIFREYGYATAGKKKFDVIDVWFGPRKLRLNTPAKIDQKGEGAPSESGKKKI